MACNDPREANEQRVRAATEQMDSEALAAMADMMEETAKKHPRASRSESKIVKPPEEWGA